MYHLFLDCVITFHMAVAPDATEEELSYAEKWRYVIQLRYVCGGAGRKRRVGEDLVNTIILSEFLMC